MPTVFTRRAFGRLAAALSAGAGSAPLRAALAQSAPPPQSARGLAASARRFPQNFLWGSATASYQVEGAVHEGGRGPSIWDTFSHTPGKVAANDTGDIADDYFHLYRDDIALMKSLGFKGCRFSVAWPRIFPSGRGTPNSAGVDFYKRMIDDLLAAGIQPFCTLYHWDLPQALEDAGGWRNRETAHAFADYAGFVTSQLADRVQCFSTMNEIRTFIELGYSKGEHAPGLQLDAAAVAQAAHFAVLGHGLAVQAIRAHGRHNTRVGLADNVDGATPAVETPEYIAAARSGMREQNAPYLTVIMEGRYTDAYLARLGAAAPKFTPEDLRTIASPLDFVGLNIYQPMFMRPDAESRVGYRVVQPPATYPHMQSTWLTVGPEVLYWAPRLVHELWHPRELYITENGASSVDVPDEHGQVWDTDRTMYLRNYLGQLSRAIADGVPVRGYFVWSLLDNFEWAEGYSQRFGIVYVDFKTQKRTPKLSAKFMQETIARNAVA